MSAQWQTIVSDATFYLGVQVADISQGLNSFIEPCYAIYDIHSPGLDNAAAELKKTVAIPEDKGVVSLCRQKRIERIELMNTANRELVSVERVLEYFAECRARSACFWILQAPARRTGATT